MAVCLPLVLAALVGAAALWLQRRNAHDTPASAADLLDAAKRLKASIRAGGGFAWVDPAEFSLPTGAKIRGIASSRAAQEGDVLVNLPGAVMLSAETSDPGIVEAVGASLRAQYSSDLDAKEMQKLVRQIGLVGGLLLERRRAARNDPAARFKDYIATLPQPPRNVVFFTEAELAAAELLTGQVPALAQLTIAEMHALVAARPDLLGAPPPDEDEIRGAVALALSRSFESAMAPLIDLANHASSSEHNAKLVQRGGQGGSYLMATRSIAAGEEVRINYGAKSDASMLAVYGFAPPGNRISATMLMNVQVPRDAPSGCKEELAFPGPHLPDFGTADPLPPAARRCGVAQDVARSCQDILKEWGADGGAAPSPLAALRADAASAHATAFAAALEAEVEALRRCAAAGAMAQSG